MFFSILVPVYNTAKYLRECMESILSQTFTDFEVVLLNDGSKDNSAEICDEYAQKDPRVRVIHKQNEGLMMTRRVGFSQANGQYCICVDSDDKLYDPKALERIHRVIIDTGCDLVLYNYVYGASESRPERVREVFDYPTGYVFEGNQKIELYDKLLTTNYMNNMWIKCPLKDILDIDTDYSVWKEDICRAEDLFQSFPMLNNAQRIGYIREPLYYYRWAPESISNNVKFRYYNAIKCIDARADEYMEQWNISVELKQRALSKRIVAVTDIICKCYFQCKSSKRVPEWKSFIKNISTDPYFVHILDGCNKKSVLLYYRLLHSLITKEMIHTAIAVINTVSFISKLKNK